MNEPILAGKQIPCDNCGELVDVEPSRNDPILCDECAEGLLRLYGYPATESEVWYG